MFLKKKTEPFMKTSYREQPNGYLETIQKGMSAVRYFNRKMSYGKGTREEQICRLKKEIEEADAIMIGAGAGLSTSAGFTYSGERFQKYFSDFEEFVKQSEFYDFYNIQDRGVIYISTIHKSKGREFDNVYILHKDTYGKTDPEKRALYVAITRAKHALYIHTNSKLFDKYSGDGIEMSFDTTEYAEPEELMLQTTYRDVVLSSFKGKRDIIFRLRSGMNLFVDGEYISVEIDGEITRIGKYSRAFVSKLESLRKKGYELVSSTVRFIVAWKGEEDTEETPIVLTDVHFKK